MTSTEVGIPPVARDPAVLYEVVPVRDVMVPMRDGARLATDLYFPAWRGDRLEGRFPVLMQRLPYGKTSKLWYYGDARYFAARGYVAVVQDVRGCYNSEGLDQVYQREPEDGYDTLAWLLEQPWCNGRVGTYGGSYSGRTQVALGAARPPGLEVQFIRQCPNPRASRGAEPDTLHSYVGGAFLTRRLDWMVQQAANSTSLANNGPARAALRKMQRELADAIRGYPFTFQPGRSPLAAIPSMEAQATEAWRRPESWNPRADEHASEQAFEDYADVPVHWLGSWYDLFSMLTPEIYRGMAARKRSPQRLTMGPWIHGPANVQSTTAGDIDFGPDAGLVYNDYRIRWFDQFLQDRQTGVLDEPPVKIFVMGGGSGRRNLLGRLEHGGVWRWEHEWPLARTTMLDLFLHRGGSLRREPPDRAAPTSYSFDPAKPVPTVGGSDAIKGLAVSGGFDQRDPTTNAPLKNRPDVLSFQSEPLASPLEVTGNVVVRLWVSSSAVDTDFTAKLLDIYPSNADYPEGYELNLVDTILRMRYRDPYRPPQPLVPGEVYEIEIVLPPTSNRFMPGHRLRIDISSSNWPRFDLNPNTGELQLPYRRHVIAENAVYHDADRPSSVRLPVIPEPSA